MFAQRGLLSVLACGLSAHGCRTFPNVPEVQRYDFVYFCRRNRFVIRLHGAVSLSDRPLRLVSMTVENYLLCKKTVV